MRALMILVVIAAFAWQGWKHYNERQATEAVTAASSVEQPKDQPYSQAVRYKKCTTAEGRVIFGEIPANVKCMREEDITSKIMLVPSTSAPSTSAPAARIDMPETPNDTESAAHEMPSSPAGSLCDGRTHCSQMRSCDEAKYFLQHCPNVEMDGNHDGVPCETQWCNY